jgi:hypothetical protein
MAETAFDLTKFKDLTSDNKKLNVDYMPLNFDALQKIGAFRVTHQGLDGGKFNPDPMAGFSLVSKYNDLAGDSSTKWKDNPAAYDVVRGLFTQNPENIGAHKYLQIVESARQLGLSDKDIFLTPPTQEQTVNPMYVDPFGNSIQ